MLTHSDQANPPGLPHPGRTQASTAAPLSPQRGNCWRETPRFPGVAAVRFGGGNSFLPEAINADVSLDDIMGWLGRRAENAAESIAASSALKPDDRPKPDPDELYPSGLRAMMPEPPEQVGNSLAVKLTRARKSRPWTCWPPGPCATTGQLAGLMGGVTRRRANQVLNSLTQCTVSLRTDRAAPCPHRRGADVPGPPGPGLRGASPGPLERRTQRLGQPAGLCRDRPARRGVPARSITPP